MLSIATAVGMVVLSVAIVWGGYLWYGRSPGHSHDGLSGEFLRDVGEGLGLDRFYRREYFGEEIRTVAGEFEGLGVELEVASGNWTPYVRLTAAFERPLEWGVSVFTDERAGIVSYVQRVQEIEIDRDEFDYHFLLYAPDADAVETLLSEPTRHQMLLLDARVDELRLTDNALFLRVEESIDRARLRSILKKGIELADRIQSNADDLGPREPETSAARYEQASIQQAVRAERGEVTPVDRSE